MLIYLIFLLIKKLCEPVNSVPGATCAFCNFEVIQVKWIWPNLTVQQFNFDQWPFCVDKTYMIALTVILNIQCCVVVVFGTYG